MSKLTKLIDSICLLILIPKALTFSIESKIAFGKNAKPHSAPYIVSLQLPHHTQYVHNCAGSMLDKNWVLTAAHCIDNPRVAKATIIKAGRHDIKKYTEEYEQKRTIKYYKIHEKYRGEVKPFDIALIYVNEPFQFNLAVKPIQLPKSGKNHTGIATLFGWGSTHIDIPNILQTVNLSIISNEQCTAYSIGPVDVSNICTGDVKGRKSCSGDSGGPLMQFNNESKNFEKVGIVSWGPAACGEPELNYSVYVRVSHFIEWIAKVKLEYEYSN